MVYRVMLITAFFAITLTCRIFPMEQKYHTLNLSNQNLTNKDLETVEVKTKLQKLAIDTQITTIDLSGNKLTYIPEYLLELPQKLILNDNPLSENSGNPKSDKRGSIGDDIKQAQDVVKQITNFFSSKEKNHSNKYKIIELGKTTIIIAPGSNIKYKELDLNSENKLVFISPKKQKTNPCWFTKYVIGGGSTLIVVATSILARYQILEFIKTLLCDCK